MLHFIVFIASCFVTFPGANFKGKYPGLKAWLDDTSKGHKAANLMVVLGPDGSCYALSRGVGWYRNSLASTLNEKLDSWRDDGKNVRHLQLGVGGSYWVEATDGSRSWNLKGNYPSLQEYVKEHKFTNVTVRDPLVYLWRCAGLTPTRTGAEPQPV